MLAISSSLLMCNKDGNNKGSAIESNFSIGPDNYQDFSGSNLLDSIDFDDLFMGMHDGDILPDLEMDPDLLAEFSLGDDSYDANYNNSSSFENNSDDGNNIGLQEPYYEANNNNNNINNDDDGIVSREVLAKKEERASKKTQEEVIESKKDNVKVISTNSSSKESGEKVAKKSSSNTKSSNKSNVNNNYNQAKRKTKVDWTPELHRRFVQAVEQLGVDKAVPSRILEIMGIDCLTRHNIASHLQKYRSHRKHLKAREEEAANWTQKRQMYGVAIGGGKGGANISSWYTPTMGFPPMTTMHPPFRPLHVWGHPTMDPQSRIPVWSKQIVPLTTPQLPSWTPLLPHHPPADPLYWHSSHRRKTGVAPVPGIPPHAMFRLNQQQPMQSTVSHPPLELLPSKESIDAAIGDVLAKPLQPLPIGLKPPSMDSVMVELQRQGISEIPPSCAEQ